MLRTLPPEIWRVVINFLGKDDQRTCLFVSKLHHDISLSYVFSSVIISFGMWQKDLDQHYPIFTLLADSVSEEIERRSTTTWELLRHISRTPAFSRYIRKLYVRPYSIGDGVFELRLLEEALEVMHNLRSFHWYPSESLLPKPFVLEALVKSSGPLLTEICLPYRAALKFSLCRLPNLRALRLMHDYDTIPDEYESPRDLISGIEANLIALTRLSVYPGSVVWDFPIRSFFGLQELEIVEPNDLGGLTLVFHHCTALSSLTLCGLNTDLIADQLVPLLTASPTALPNLTGLKVMSDMVHYSPPQLTLAVSAFLANKRRLRMLDLVLHLRNNDSQQPQIWNHLPELPALEVLGLDVRSNNWSDSEIQRLDKGIPLCLSALLIVVHVYHLPPLWETPYSPEWIKLIRKRTSLSYLHVLDVQGVMHLMLEGELLEDHPDSLQLVGYGPYLKQIVPDNSDSAASDHLDDAPARGPYCYSEPWPLEKVAHRTVEDFGCAEWEWLLRHHGASTLDDLYPGPTHETLH